MSPAWKLRLYYGGILTFIVGTMVIAPVLILLLVPLLVAVTKWSALAWAAESIAIQPQVYEEDYRPDPREKLIRRRQRRRMQRRMSAE